MTGDARGTAVDARAEPAATAGVGAASGGSDERRAGLWEALRSEWVKLRSVRATALTPLVLVAATIGIAIVVGLTGSLQPDDTILGGSLTGGVLAQLAAACFGVLAMSGEYGTGLIRTTLSATPQRGTVLAAKALLVAGVLLVAGLLAGGAAYAIGRVLLDGEGYAPGEPLPALLGIAACVAAAGLLGLAAATMLRHTAGAIVTACGVILLPTLIGPLLGTWQRWVVGAAPPTALRKLSQSSDMTSEVAGSLGGWASLGLVAAYTALALLVAGWLLRRRDA